MLLGDVRAVESVLRTPHGLLEAPRIGPGGELVFSDVIAGGLWEYSPENATTRELLPKRRGIGGAVPHAGGGWVHQRAHRAPPRARR